MANLTHAELVTPERILFSGDAESVTMRADGGDTTFLANHMDYIASVDVCVVRIAAAEAAGGTLPADQSGSAPSATGESSALGEVRVAVHGGFVKVADNKVTIVAGVAELADEIDIDRARRALEAAEAAIAAGGGAPAVTTGDAEAGSDEAEGASSAAPDAPEAAAARARARLEAAGQTAA